MKKSKILVVEDNEMAALGLQVMLELLNCDVDIAETGKKALKKINIKKYDLVVLDIGLPDISGYEVSEEIRKRKTALNKDVPIIALSGQIDEHDRKDRIKCLQAGMNEAFSKPLLKETAEEILRIFLPAIQ